MSYQKLLQWVIGSTLVLLLLVRCGAPPATPVAPTVPPTVTPVPPTDTPEPPSCEKVEGICLELTFDGESCTYEDPTALKAGPVTLLFLNESDDHAAVNLMIHTGDETIQDMIDDIEEVPFKPQGALWARELGTYRDVRPGESQTWEGILEPGIHTMVCVRLMPLTVWFGTGLTVED